MSNAFDALTAEQIAKQFDDGEDVLEYFDLENPQVNAPLRSVEQKRVTLTMSAVSYTHLSFNRFRIQTEIVVLDIIKNRGCANNRY